MPNPAHLSGMSKQTKIIVATVVTSSVVVLGLVLGLVVGTGGSPSSAAGLSHSAQRTSANTAAQAKARSVAASKAAQVAAQQAKWANWWDRQKHRPKPTVSAHPTPTPTHSTSVPKPPTSSTSTAPSGGGSSGGSSSSSTSIPPPSSSSSGPAPASCASNGPYVWANLATCGWPSAANTGPVVSQCPGGLKAVSGTVTVTKANTVVQCENISGCMKIEAPGVTVQNVKIACTSGKTGENANGTSVIYVDDGASATISHVEINGMDGVHACIWHQGTAMTANAVNCYGIDDGIFSWADTGYSSTTGDHFTIENSYFHDFTTKTANGHIDGYQTEGASNGTITHNTYLMTSDDGNSSDSAIAIWNSLKSSSNIAVSNNLIAGGGFAVYAEDYSPSEASPAGGFTVTNISFTNNVFSQHLFGCVGYYGVWFSRGNPSDGWHRSGNKVLETGQSLDGGNPTYKGNSCT
jgi:hypothetical protein